eukprot:gb/GEZN01002957.1/.p1 GENE.gb/GEZN01002957.1/~~gb/GEZN01002957.1/.p1  ORF type:complete len:651 (-),score=86.59 gb/GEZN01002957.1/:285-2237(-)
MEVNAMSKFMSVGKDMDVMRKLTTELDALAAEKDSLKKKVRHMRKVLEREGWHMTSDGRIIRADRPAPPQPPPNAYLPSLSYLTMPYRDEELSSPGSSAPGSPASSLSPSPSRPVVARPPPIRARPYKSDEEVWLRRILWLRYLLGRFGRGFLMAWSVRASLSVLTLFLRAGLAWLHLRRTGRAGRTLPDWVTLLKQALFGPYPIGYGIFLGWLLAGSELGMGMTQETQLPVRMRTLLAGLVAGLAINFVPAAGQTGVVLFTFVRAGEIIIYALEERGWLPHVEHGDTLTMMLASAQILYAFVFHQSSLEPGYIRFLLHHAGKPAAFVQAYKELNSGPFISEATRQALNQLPRVTTLSVEMVANWHEIVHPGQGCLRHFLTFLYQGVVRSLAVYLPVHLLPTLFFRWNKLFQDPLGMTLDTTWAVFRSSVFLAAYCGMAWFSTCCTRTLGYKGMLNPAIAGLCGGAMVFIEKKSRRIELGLYVLAQAFGSFYGTWAGQAWWLPILPRGKLVLFACSFAIILDAYVNQPLLLRRSYFGILKFFLGKGSKFAGYDTQPTPSPSSGDLSADKPSWASSLPASASSQDLPSDRRLPPPRQQSDTTKGLQHSPARHSRPQASTEGENEEEDEDDFGYVDVGDISPHKRLPSRPNA